MTTTTALSPLMDSNSEVLEPILEKDDDIGVH
jgi:hypothetical protein